MNVFADVGSAAAFGGFVFLAISLASILVGGFIILSPIFIYSRLGDILREIRSLNATLQRLEGHANAQSVVQQNIDKNICAALNSTEKR
jgi:hypothetical protein